MLMHTAGAGAMKNPGRAVSSAMVAAATLGTVMGPMESGARSHRPNVLFIMVDDLGWSGLGCYGSPFFDTPNIDRLAERGLLFTDAYSSAPSCTPTRNAFLTGQHPARTGITHIPWFNQHRTAPRYSVRSPIIPDKMEGPVVTIAHLLQQNGYATGQWGKWHMNNTPEEFGFDMGGDRKYGIHDFPGASTAPRDNNRDVWDRYLTEFPDLEYGEYLGCELVDKAIEFITAHKDQPWFYLYDPFLVHTPILSRHKWLIDKYTERFEKMGVTNVNPTYAAMTETLDWTVGEIMGAIEKLGLLEDTIVFFTSDNGAVQGIHHFPFQVTDNHPLYGGKVSMHEGGIRVPLLIVWPGVIPAGVRTSAVVDTLDFYPTIATMTGARLDPEWILDGEDLTPLLRGERGLERESIFWHFPHFVTRANAWDDRYTDYVGVIRRGEWKLMLRYEDDGIELYNLVKDIGETQDRSMEFPELARSMKAELQRNLKEKGAAMPDANPGYHRR